MRVSKLSFFLVGDPAGDRRLQAFNKQSSQSALLAHNHRYLPLPLPFFSLLCRVIEKWPIEVSFHERGKEGNKTKLRVNS